MILSDNSRDIYGYLVARGFFGNNFGRIFCRRILGEHSNPMGRIMESFLVGIIVGKVIFSRDLFGTFFQRKI